MRMTLNKMILLGNVRDCTSNNKKNEMTLFRSLVSHRKLLMNAVEEDEGNVLKYILFYFPEVAVDM